MPAKAREKAARSTRVIVVADDASDARRLLDGDLRFVAESFDREYRRLSDADSLRASDVGLEAAQSLHRFTQHLRDIAWRTPMSAEDAELCASVFETIFPSMRRLLDVVSGIELRLELEKGRSADGLLSVVALGIETCATYCCLVSTYGVPLALVQEEMGVAVVGCLKQCMKQIVFPLMQPRESAAEQLVATALNALPEPVKATHAAIASMMHELHELLCRHGLDDGLLHQLVHLAIGCFFSIDPYFNLTSAAEELLVTIFTRKESLRTSILQDFLVRAPQLPAGRRARKFLLPVAQESTDIGLSTWTHLLLRLVQATSLPLVQPIGAEADFSDVLAAQVSVQSVLSRLTNGLIQRFVLTRTRDEELRMLFEEIVEQVLDVAFRPTWPGAFAWIRIIGLHLVAIIQPDKRRAAQDASAREFALKVLSRIASKLTLVNQEVKKGMLRLPAWDETGGGTAEERLLQHIALRVSLEHGGEFPWSEAARAVKAWDADIYVPAGSHGSTELGHFTDDMVFRYLVLAHLEDERYLNARVPRNDRTDAAEAFSACVFAAGHPVYAWSFLVCDWTGEEIRKWKEAGLPVTAEEKLLAEKQAARTARGNAQRRLIVETDAGGNAVRQAFMEKFLACAWTSKIPFYGGGSSWRSAGGRRLLMPFTVYKIYRQLRIRELDSLRKLAIDCLVFQANSSLATCRKTAMRGLSDIIDVDGAVVWIKAVEETIELRLRDESSLVRQVSLDLLGRILEGSLNASLETGDGEALWAAPPAEDAAAQMQVKGRGEAASAMLLRFHSTVRGRIHDTSVMVRRQASKMLSAFVLNHPDHPDLEGVCVDLLRRAADSEIIRNLVVGTFELLFFADDEPTPRQARQLACIVEASRGTGVGPADILGELLVRFKKSMSSRRHGKGFEHAVRRWTTVLLHEFVKYKSDPIPSKRVGKKTSSDNLPHTDSKLHESQLQRRSLLSALELFATTLPSQMFVHLRPLTVYLALEVDSSSAEEQWIATKVCQILSTVLPHCADRRGVMDHRQVQHDLQALIKTLPSSGVRESVRCLCNVVKYVSGDLTQILVHLNNALPALAHLCEQGEKRPASLHRIQKMFMSRQAWVLASVLEGLHIDDFIEKPGVSLGGRFLPKSALRFEVVGGSVATTVADLLVRLHSLGEPSLQAVVITCLGFFLQGQRSFVKEKRISDIFAAALASTDVALQVKVLATLATLLGHFGHQAERETRPLDTSGGGGTAIESAQPLAAYGDAVIKHLSSGFGSTPAVTNCDAEDEINRVRAEALTVVRLLQVQGLVNPMAVLPRAFALCFWPDPLLSEPAGAMMKDMLELRPSLLLNRLDESFREAFHSVLVAGGCGGRSAVDSVNLPLEAMQLVSLCEVYAERFRKQRGHREAFIRKILRELLRLPSDSFREQVSGAVRAVSSIVVPDDAPGKENRKGSPAKRLKVSLARQRKGSGAPLKRIRVVDVDASEEEGDEAQPNGILGRSASSVVDARESTLRALSPFDRYRVLYAQFVCCVVTALPYVFEAEPMLVVFECNRHLALHAGSIAAGNAGPLVREPQAVDGDMSDDEAGANSGDRFGEAICVLACLLLKRTVKHDYGLTSEACAQFNPKDVRQERLKFIGCPALASRAATEASGVNEDTVPHAAKLRFPIDEWRVHAASLAACASSPVTLAAKVRALVEDDPFDSNVGRHVAAIDRLEGRVKKSRRVVSSVGISGKKGLTRAGRTSARRKRKAVGNPEEFVAALEEALEPGDTGDAE